MLSSCQTLPPCAYKPQLPCQAIAKQFLLGSLHLLSLSLPLIFSCMHRACKSGLSDASRRMICQAFLVLVDSTSAMTLFTDPRCTVYVTCSHVDSSNYERVLMSHGAAGELMSASIPRYAVSNSHNTCTRYTDLLLFASQNLLTGPFPTTGPVAQRFSRPLSPSLA